MPRKYTNPAGVSTPVGFSHVVEVTGAQRLIYVAGQTAAGPDGNVVGVGDFKAQVEQVYSNVKACLESHGASFADVVKTTTFIVNYDAAVHRPVLTEIRTKYLPSENPPASTLLGVQALARPEFLVEVEATAVI
jgi:enamine deaminase RidA (YjgF/YER057c/UK114 family)